MMRELKFRAWHPVGLMKNGLVKTAHMSQLEAHQDWLDKVISLKEKIMAKIEHIVTAKGMTEG